MRELVRMECWIGLRGVVIAGGSVLRHNWKAGGFPHAEPTCDTRDVGKAFRLQHARSDRGARPALTVYGDGRVARNVPRELREIAEEEMRRAWHVSGVPLGLTPHVDHEAVIVSR